MDIKSLNPIVTEAKQLWYNSDKRNWLYNNVWQTLRQYHIRFYFHRIPRKIYLYLEKVEWVDTWINGGKVPLYLASKYLSVDRKGTQTPDENLNRNFSGKSYENFTKLYNVGTNSKMNINISYNKVTVGGKIMDGGNTRFSQNYEDAVVLCFSTEFSSKLAKMLGKNACVQIINFKKLKKELDSQIGNKGIAGRCCYTSSPNRNHFLKGKEDKWQKEFRVIWKIDSNIEVEIPKNIAVELKLI